jgi:hypothetical protein
LFLRLFLLSLVFISFFAGIRAFVGRGAFAARAQLIKNGTDGGTTSPGRQV